MGVSSPRSFVESIEGTQDEAVDLTFDSPSALIEHLGKTDAEQATAQNPVKR